MSAVELLNELAPRFFRHVLMDWDGTTALTRAGWSEIMADVFAENLPCVAGETSSERRAMAHTELMRLNGRPSIHQMARLAEMIVERGGVAQGPDIYQADFQRRLSSLIHTRIRAIEENHAKVESLLVPGARAFFSQLALLDIPVSLASGTPLPQLKAEIEMLGLGAVFAERVHGPLDLADRSFSKRAVIADILKNISGRTLLTLGDGPVEIAETKAVGGIAIGIASDEAHPGRVDTAKRRCLIAAGADAILPDLNAAPMLLECWHRVPAAAL